MRVIHKFGPFKVCQQYEIENVHRIVHFAKTSEGIFVWCEKDKEGLRSQNIEILIVKSGMDYEDIYDQVGTLIEPAGYVLHLLQAKNSIMAMA